MSAIAWDTIRDAVQAWITTGSGLAGDHVIWSGQRDASGNAMPRPSGEYIELKLTLIAWSGFSDWRSYEYNAGTNTFTDRLRGPRSLMLTATCYEGMPAGGTGHPSSTHPMAILNDAMTSLGLDPVSDGLVAAGVGVGNVSAIDVPGGTFNNARFEARAIATVKLHVASEVSYAYPVGTGWIDIVNASGNSPGDLASVSVHVDGTNA